MPNRSPLLSRTLAYASLALLMLVAALLFDNKGSQAWNMTLPFFTGAANYQLGHGWMHDEEAIRDFAALPTREAREAYRFPHSDRLTPYNFQAKGYMYVSLVARNLFFWQGDFKAVESLQVLTHILLTLLILSKITSTRGKVLFFVLWGMNPLAYYLATYPLYYYWQTLPTTFICLYLLDRNLQFGAYAPLVAASASFIFSVRPSTLFALLFLIALLLHRESPRVRVASLGALVLSGLIFFQGSLAQNPWHTAYVGVGAYPNPYVHEFTDRPAIDLYEQHTGVPLDPGLGGNHYDEDVRREFRRICKLEFMAIALERPSMLLRNAILNFFESFSLGYVTDYPLLSYVSAVVGLLYLGLLLVTRKFLFAAAIALNSLSFVPYYPPIPAYMFGAYVLIVAAFVDLTANSLRWKLPRALFGA